MNFVKYYHTLKYLKASQISWRLFYRFKKTTIKYAISEVKLRNFNNKPLMTLKKSAFINETTVCFLNKAQDISSETCWNNPNYEKLWLYNLHYFDDLNAENAHERTQWHSILILRWIAENPVGKGNGWEPYPLSLRIVNWLKWALRGNVLTTEMQHSLVLQVRFLMKRLEWHLLGNHLLANAKALVYAGIFFEGKEAKLWFNKGARIFAKQLPAQILADGAHFELSPMYHSIILEDLLDVIQLYQCYGLTVPILWPIIITNMLAWLQTMTHPDGQLSFFNDSAFKIALSLAELHRYARRLNVHVPLPVKANVHHLVASGYCRLQNASAVLLADIAAVGPHYLPGHAHADTLSCEFSLKTQRILVNSGTSTYENNALRAKQRSTSAHNTLVIDDENSSDVWGAFRVARRARVFNIKTLVDDHTSSLTASHNGYLRLAAKPIHTRIWCLTDQSLTIKDTVTSNAVHTSKLYFHFHPSLIVFRLNEKNALLSNAVGRVATISSSEALIIETGFFYPTFNQQVANQYIVIEKQHVSAVQIITEFTWV